MTKNSKELYQQIAAPQHDIKIGDIFYNSWGYEQTNIDFYQVVKTTAKTITIRPIDSEKTYNSNTMDGTTIPTPNRFIGIGNEMRKTPELFNGVWFIRFEYGVGRTWDGNPMRFSCYA